MDIEKKITPEYFELVKSGKKKFEIRLGDWTCKEGDNLILKEWDPITKKYTGNSIKKKVSLVINTKEIKFFNKEDIDKYGFQVISLD